MPPIRNALMVRYARGYRWVEDAGSIATYGRREGYLSTIADTPEEADRIGGAVQSTRLVPSLAFAAALEPVGVGVSPTGGGDDPYVDFAPADTITVPDDTGAPTVVQVVALTVTEDEEGNPFFRPELGSLVEAEEVRVARWLGRMDRGSLGGSTESAAPARPPKPALVAVAVALELPPFSIAGPVAAGQISPPYFPPAGCRIVEAVVSAITPGTVDTVIDVYKNLVTVVATLTLPATDQQSVTAVDIPLQGPKLDQIALGVTAGDASHVTVTFRAA